VLHPEKHRRYDDERQYYRLILSMISPAARIKIPTKAGQTHPIPMLLLVSPPSGALVGVSDGLDKALSEAATPVGVRSRTEGVLEGSSVTRIVDVAVACSVSVAVCVAVWVGTGGMGVSLAGGGLLGCSDGWLEACVAVLDGVALISWVGVAVRTRVGTV
jgi:hypothetical protein